jgi:HlyD family secretion protein
MGRRLVVLLLLVTAFVFAAYILTSREERGVQVEMGVVARQKEFRSYVTASGEIVAIRYADIGSDIMGKVVSLPVAEGQRVRAGQLLAAIDAVQAKTDLDAATEQVAVLEAEELAVSQDVDAAESQLNRAEAAFSEARIKLARTEKLYGEGVAPRADLDSARFAYQAAEADVRTAAAQLNRARKSLTAAGHRIGQAGAGLERSRDLYTKTEVRSPMDGVVSRLRVREGEMVVIGIQNQPGTTLMTISDLSGIDAEVKVAEADVLKLEVGQTAEVTLDALPERRFPGRVVEIGTSALPTLGTAAAAREFRVVVRLDSPDPGLRPGLTCDVEILTTRLSGALTVPLQAVVIRAVDGVERTGVFTADGNRAAFRPVRAGAIGGLDIVVEGLEEGTRIISGPFQILRDLQDGESIEQT